MSTQEINAAAAEIVVKKPIRFEQGCYMGTDATLLTHYEYTDDATVAFIQRGATWTTPPTYTFQLSHFDHIGRTISFDIELHVSAAPTGTLTGTVHLPLAYLPQGDDEQFITLNSSAIALVTNETLYAITNSTNQELDLYVYKTSGPNPTRTPLTADRIKAGTISFNGVYHDLIS